MEQFNGKIIIFSAPSGAGKSTIVRMIMERFDGFGFSVSATTRPSRGQEIDGVHYHFITPEVFKEKIKNGEFLEWEEVYEGRFYGTLKSEVNRVRKHQHVLFDVDVQGGVNIKQHYGDEAISFFIQPPSIRELRRRLILRGTDELFDINRRCEKAAYELQYAPLFDHIILNDDLETAVRLIEKILEKMEIFPQQAE